MDDESGKSGFFNRVVKSFREGSRPVFAPQKDESEASKRAATGGVASTLKSAEDAASEEVSSRGDSLGDARNDEEQVRGFYNRRFNSAVSAAQDIQKGKFKSAFKKAGPITGLFLVVFMTGMGIAGTQVFQPFSLVAQFQAAFNTMHPSAYNRSATFLRYQMTNGTRTSPIVGTVLGGEKFSLSKKQIAEYEKQGIKYNDQFELNGKKIRVLEYETDGGQKRIVTVDKETAEAINKAGLGRAASFSAMLNDSSFSRKFAIASQTWRGQFANWFGTKTGDFLARNKLTRNMFKDWKKTKEKTLAENGTAIDAVRETIKNRITEGSGGGVARREQKKDKDGNVIEDKTTASRNSKVNSAEVKAKLENIKGKISGGVNIGCSVADFVGAVSLMVVAAEAIQIVNLATSLMETVDKVKAGHGDEAPINEWATLLNEEIATDHAVISYDSKGQTVNDGGDSTTVYAKTESVKGEKKSAMQSKAIEALFSNNYVDPTDPSVKSFNLTSSANTILGGLGMSAGSFMACTATRALAAAASVAVDVVACLTGVGCVATLLKGFLFAGAVGLAIAGVIQILIPWLTSVFERNLADSVGEDLGNAVFFGAHMHDGNIHKTNGGTLTNRKKYVEFTVAQQQVIAEEAENERAILSPFDTSSTNTFMGSILTQLMTFNTSNSLMSTITSINTIANSSLVTLTPSTSAIALSIEESLPTEEDYAKTCPYLASIGAVGDSGCVPYIISDIGTMAMEPAVVINKLADPNGDGDISDGIFEDKETSDGNVVLKKSSDFIDYAVYGAERVSAWGVADQNTANSFKSTIGNTVVGTAIDTAIGIAPIIGDLVDIYDSEEVMKNMGYVTGEFMVAGNDGSNLGGNVPKWDRVKLFQRFTEDQSLAESMGIISKSAVAVALEDYYKENPLDNSYEGVLARYSGLEKETVADLLDIFDYYDYIANYNPSERYAFGGGDAKSEDGPMFDNENELDGAYIMLNEIVYADVRNRSFAV